MLEIVLLYGKKQITLPYELKFFLRGNSKKYCFLIFVFCCLLFSYPLHPFLPTSKNQRLAVELSLSKTLFFLPTLQFYRRLNFNGPT